MENKMKEKKKKIPDTDTKKKIPSMPERGQRSMKHETKKNKRSSY